MHNYLNFRPRLDTTPRVKTPIVSEVYFAWCCQNNEGKWEEGDCFLQPTTRDGRHPNSVSELEEDRRGDKFDLDYEKGYFDNHYIMLVVHYYQEAREHTLYFTPEHAFKILDNLYDMKQFEYSWEELNPIEEEENEEDS